MRRRTGLGPLRRPILAGLLVYELAWAALIIAYARFAADPPDALVLSFPAPTALMLYVLWPLPLIFMWIYLRAFDSWFLTDRDLARFRALLAERDEAEDAGSAAAPRREP